MGKIESIRIRGIRRPLKTVFATALGQKAFLQNVLVSVALDDGSMGVGEIPTSFSRKHETVAVIRGVLKQVRAELKGVSVDAYQERIMDLRRRFPRARMSISGLEVALFRAFLAGRRSHEYQFLGGNADTLETDITVPFVPDVASVTRWLQYALREGFRLFKIKVSGDLDADKHFLSMTSEIIARSELPFRMRLDGNQGYTLSTFLKFAEWVHKKGYPVELFEQPLDKYDLDGLRTARNAALLPIILDEGVDALPDAQRAIDEGLCDGINIKIAKSGITESLEIARLAQANGLKLMIGCMTETMVGLSAAIHLAAGTGCFDYIDLDSVYFVRHRKRYDDILLDGPTLSIR